LPWGEHSIVVRLKVRRLFCDNARCERRVFTGLVRDRAPERLDPSLQQAQDGVIPALRRFAKRLSADYAAVRAAVMLAWSNGPAGGQISRLKSTKRQMYSRAELDLLKRRFLLAGPNPTSLLPAAK